jgi:hypothetical protein
MNRSILALIGFISFALGLLSLILIMLGIQFSFLTWIDMFGRLPGLIIRVFMIFGGLIMLYVARTEMDV